MKEIRCLKCQKSIQNKPFYGLHAPCFVDWFQLSEQDPSMSEQALFKNLDPKKPASADSSSGSLTKTKDSFYHGRYRKYSATLGDQQYILKVEESGFPDLPATEYLCNKIASHLGLKVPEYYLIRWTPDSHSSHEANEPATPAIKELKKNGLMAFVTKNFMQGLTGSTLHHIYKFLPKGDDNYNCQNIIKAIMKETKQPAEVGKFIKTCLFDSFIGNNDRHGRNLGIINTGKKRFLSPMYDNPSWLATEEFLAGQFNISGSIWTSSSEKPKIKDYIQEFQKLNKAGCEYLVNDNALSLERQKKPAPQKIPIRYHTICSQFMKKTISQFPKIIKEVQYAEISEKRKKAFIRFLNNRLKDMEQILKEEEKNV